MIRKRNYLATTGLYQIWDPNADIIFLGPWCLNGSNREFQDKGIRLIQNINYATRDLSANAAYCEKVYFKLIEKLAVQLNKLHDVDRSTRYWSVILNPWLICYIPMLHEKYLRMLDALKQSDGQIYTHYVEPDDTFAPHDNHDFFFEKINNDYYHLQLISQIALFLGMDYRKVHLKLNENEISLPDKTYIRDEIKLLLKKIIIQTQRLFLKDNKVAMVDMYHLKFWDYFLFNIALNSQTFMELDFPYWRYQNFAYSGQLRSKLELRGNDKDPFVNLVQETIPKTIPRYCVEGFQHLAKQINHIKRTPPKLIVSATGWHFNEKFKFYAAQMEEEYGARLVGVQHGGDYGFSRYQSFFIFELKNKDRFFSWGWKDGDNAEKIEILPEPYLSQIKDKAKQDKDFILFISFNYQKYLYALLSYPGPDGLEEYFQQQFLFLRSIPENLKTKLYYRPYPLDFGRNIKEKVKRIMPSVKFAEEGRSIDWMKRAKLVIIDHPITSLIEGLVTNVPLILYWDPRLWTVKEEAREYFDLLREAGILYHDLQEAASKLNDIYRNAKYWRSQKEVQEARIKFIRKYGYARADWRKVWVDKLQTITRT